MSQLQHFNKKGKITVTEGTGGLIFKFKIDPIQLKCQCSNRPRESVCRHLEYYLCKVMGIKHGFLPVLSVPRVRSKITQIWGEPQTLNLYCYKFLTDDEVDQCLICHEQYLKLSSNGMLPDVQSHLHQCPKCFELYHHSCHLRWLQTGGGCPRCKYKRDL